MILISFLFVLSCSQIPMFVQLHNRWRRLYFGQSESPGFRTVFEMAHLKSIPPQYSHLAGLLNVFKAKLVRPFLTKIFFHDSHHNDL